MKGVSYNIYVITYNKKRADMLPTHRLLKYTAYPQE